MKKTILFFMFFMIAAMQVFAQEMSEIDEKEKSFVIDKINKVIARVTTLQCDFKQTKKLSLLKDVAVSTGTLTYKQDKKLRWEYVTPTSYIFVLNDDLITIKASGKTSNINTKQNKVFEEIARIMMNSITGECLTDVKTFSTTLYNQNGTYVAELVPQRKEMKKMFKSIRLTFSKSQNMVEKVEMIENKGDITTIELFSPVINKSVADEVFSIQ